MMKLGIIEGFYGKPWTHQERVENFSFLSSAGYSFYIYAPKGDPYFRKKWREPLPEAHLEELRRLREAAREAKLEFGIGLSPYELYRSFDESARTALGAKLELFAELQLDSVAVLFDDMRGDLPDLANKQLEILGWIQERLASSQKMPRLIFCPTYYTDDPVLDRVFGQRPEGYVEQIGRELDPSIDIFWTGPMVCSTDYPEDHLERVAGELRRRPFVWDNYPVNDGQRMCQFLHLRAFTGRPARLKRQLSGLAVNPMNQAVLSRIPMLTLNESLHSESYDPDESFRRACKTVGEGTLGRLLIRDVALFQDAGLKQMDSEKRASLREEYGAIDHPGAREVARWLDGEFEVSAELVRTQ